VRANQCVQQRANIIVYERGREKESVCVRISVCVSVLI